MLSNDPRHDKTCLRGFPNRSDTKWAVQPQNLVRDLKFWIYKEEGMYYLCSKNRGTDQLRCTAWLICTFILAYAKSRFSHGSNIWTVNLFVNNHYNVVYIGATCEKFEEEKSVIEQNVCPSFSPLKIYILQIIYKNSGS